MHVSEAFGAIPATRHMIRYGMDALCEFEIPRKKNEPASDKCYVDIDKWAGGDIDRDDVLDKFDADPLITVKMNDIARDARDAFIVSKILEFTLQRADLRKEVNKRFILAQADKIKQLWTGSAAIPGPNFGKCELMGWHPGHKIMLMDDSILMCAFSDFVSYYKDLTGNFFADHEFLETLYTLGLFIFVVTEKLTVVNNRSDMHAGAGYGVMTRVDKWEKRIKGVVTWLKNHEQCPTQHHFIVSERVRLSGVAGAAAE